MEPVYRYFVQPQIDNRTHTIFGYELLIKQKTPAGWRLPESFAAIDVGVMSDLLIATTKILGTKVQYCSVNVNREQLVDPKMTNAIIQSQLQLYPTKLVVELTEEDNDSEYSVNSLIPHLRNFMEHGMQISLDDVGTGDNSYEEIRNLLPLASEIKFALQNFRHGIDNDAVQRKLRVWKAISQEFGLRLILEGIEDEHDDAISDELEIDLRQGYYYGKPQLLPISKEE